MKPAWDQLIEEYANSKATGVYDVDCTADGKSLCEKIEVKSYPTIKYGDPSDMGNLKDYSGGRDFEALKKFADENLGPVCGPSSLDACEPEDREMLEGFLKRPASELASTIKALDAKFKSESNALNKKRGKILEKLQDVRDDTQELGSEPKDAKKKKKWAEKKAPLEKKRVDLEAQKDGIDEKDKALQDEVKKAGMKLMKLALKEVAARKEEF